MIGNDLYSLIDGVIARGTPSIYIIQVISHDGTRSTYKLFR